jgi:DNA-directed RNA polymerase subunit RPC12/RpoP
LSHQYRREFEITDMRKLGLSIIYATGKTLVLKNCCNSAINCFLPLFSKLRLVKENCSSNTVTLNFINKQNLWEWMLRNKQKIDKHKHLACQRCGHKWPYKGHNPFFTLCPRCRTTVRTKKKSLSPVQVPGGDDGKNDNRN